MNKEQPHGFIPSVIDEQEHYVLGDNCLGAKVLMPGGNGWIKYLPPNEIQQKNGLETMNCSNYGTLNCLEILGKFKYGAEFQNKLSERYTGVFTGTTIYGNDPHKVIEIIRKDCGVIPETFLPFDGSVDTWGKYYSPSPMKYDLYKMGASWLRKYIVGHDWVFTANDSMEVKHQKMKLALESSPLGVSVDAWHQGGDGLYRKQGIDNHWVSLIGYVNKVKWIVFDSYESNIKELAWDTNFGQAKRYSLDKRSKEATGSYIIPYGAYLAGWYLGQIFK